MIRAYILIETAAGKTYRYVRDALATNALGVAELFYRYRGNGYQDFNITVSGELKFSPLVFDTTYSVNIQVDGGAVVERSIRFPAPSNEIGILNIAGGSIRYADILEKLARVANGTYLVDIIDKDIRITSNSTRVSTSAIAITAGSTGTDLLAALSSTPSTAIVSDNFDNQITLAGKISEDFDTLSTNWLAGGLLDFPENAGDTPILRRKNLWNGLDDETQTIVQIEATHVTSLIIVEEIEDIGYTL